MQERESEKEKAGRKAGKEYLKATGRKETGESCCGLRFEEPIQKFAVAFSFQNGSETRKQQAFKLFTRFQMKLLTKRIRKTYKIS
jgi:hypothetical protein